MFFEDNIYDILIFDQTVLDYVFRDTERVY
jgi:hypothetical protein